MRENVILSLVQRLERSGYSRSQRGRTMPSLDASRHYNLTISLSDRKYLLEDAIKDGSSAIVHTQERNLFSLSVLKEVIVIYCVDDILRISFSFHGHYRHGDLILGTGFNGRLSGIRYTTYL